MIIGPVHDTDLSTRYAVLINQGPGSNQSKCWNFTDGAWETLFATIAEETIELTGVASGSSAWAMQYAAVPTAIPATQAMRALIFVQAGASPDFSNDTYEQTIDVGGSGLGIGEHRIVSHAFTFLLGRRADGTTVAFNAIRVRPGETVAAAFDIDLLAAGALVASMASLSITGSAATVTMLNDNSVLGSQAKFELDATAGTDGSDYTVTCLITTDDGDVFNASGVVECRA